MVAPEGLTGKQTQRGVEGGLGELGGRKGPDSISSQGQGSWEEPCSQDHARRQQPWG